MQPNVRVPARACPVHNRKSYVLAIHLVRQREGPRKGKPQQLKLFSRGAAVVQGVGRYVVSTISNRPGPCILAPMEDVREAAGFALVTLAVVATVVLLLVMVLI